MKISKKQMCISIASICVLLVATVVMVLDFVIPLNFWVHPVLTFFFIAFAGFGIMCVIVGVTTKSTAYYCVGGVLLTLALFYMLFCIIFTAGLGLVVALPVAIIVPLVILAIILIVAFMQNGNKTEAIALNREGSDYKDYKERRAEKQALEAEKEPEEMPEIKSFK